MNLRQQITPKNDDGSIDHRYVPIAKAIAELAGKRVEAQLYKLYVETNKLEKESATAGLTWLLLSPLQDGTPVKHSVVTPLIHACSLTPSGLVELV